MERKPYVPPKAEILPLHNPKKKLPKIGEEVLVIIKTSTGEEIHEGHLYEDGRWYIYKHGFWLREVIGWKPKPRIDEFTNRFLSFSFGFAVGVVFVYAVTLFMG